MFGDSDVAATPRVAAWAIALAMFDQHDPAGMPVDPLGDDDFHELVSLVENHRLLGALVEAVESGQFPVSEGQLGRIRERHRNWSLNVLKVERLLMKVTDRFESAGIEFRIVKGVALAHTVYDDPTWRVFADVDLLIRSHQIDRAVDLVTNSLGGQRTVAELRPGFDREFGKEAMLVIDGMELDVHRTLVSGPFGLTVDVDELMAGGADLEVGDRTLTTLGPASRYLSACYNLALGDYPVRLGAVRDLFLIDRLGDVDVATITDIARRWQASAVVCRAANLMSELQGGTPSPTLRQLAELQVPTRERVALRTYLTPTRSYRRQVASLLVIPGVRPRLRYLRALVTPSGDYLASRGWTERSHVRRAARRLAGKPDD